MSALAYKTIITGPVESVFYGGGRADPCRIALSIHQFSNYDNLYLLSHNIESCGFAERCKQSNSSVNIYVSEDDKVAGIELHRTKAIFRCVLH